MKDYLITEIVQGMLPYLDNAQLMRLREKVTECLSNKVVTDGSMVDNDTGTSNDEFVEMFIAAKKFNPKAILIENVPSIEKLYSGKFYDLIISEFEKNGNLDKMHKALGI